MDVIFNCKFCDQELAVDSSGTGTEIECPSCGERIVIPEPDLQKVEPHPVNPIAASAAAKESRHFAVPQRDKAPEPVIAKPLKPLEASAKEGIHVRIRTFKRSDCVEVGKDRFDEIVSAFLQTLGEASIISVVPVTYSHQDMASHAWISDYGVLIVYRG